VIEPLASHRAQRHADDSSTAVVECLAEETAVALLFNGLPHVVLMATPTDLQDLALGYALSEGIVDSPEEFELVDCLQREGGLALHVAVPQHRFEALQHRRGSLLATGGCGLCGAEALDHAIRPVRRVEARESITVSQLLAAFEALAEAQVMNRACGSLHAAAALGADSLLVREDVGRHNAVDKVIGACAARATGPLAVLVTSRGSFELVHKVAAAGVGVLASVSAPTAHAVRLAEQAGLTLVGFARDERLTVYSQGWRLGP